MVDLHCHILPNVDDGPQSLVESIEMARMAVKEGIHTIIATPHHKNGKYKNTKTEIIDKVTRFNIELQKENIDLTILPGQEVRIYGEILEDLQKGEILPLNHSKYLFIELPSGHVPRYTDQLLFELQMKGLIPVIVHPERNQELIEQPELLYQFVKRGALTQITASSIAGYFGKNIKTFSLQLIDANLTHFVSSDAHNISNRSSKMTEAYALIEKKYGIDTVYMFRENAELLVADKNIYKEVPERVKRKKILGLF